MYAGLRLLSDGLTAIATLIGNPYEGRDPRQQPSCAELTRIVERQSRMLQVDEESIEASRLGDLN